MFGYRSALNINSLADVIISLQPSIDERDTTHFQPLMEGFLAQRTIRARVHSTTRNQLPFRGPVFLLCKYTEAYIDARLSAE
jgi:hypothetical protein